MLSMAFFWCTLFCHEGQEAKPLLQDKIVAQVVDKTGVIHVPVGKVSFDPEKIQGNSKVLLDAVVKAKPSTAKGKYVKKVNLAPTMGPGVLLDEVAYAK